MKIVFGTDHAGFYLKEALKPYVESLGHEVIDKGAFAYDAGDDYPDFIFPAVQMVASGEADRGIVIGSSGQGEGIAANRVKGVRALVYYGAKEPLKDTAKVGELKSLVQVSREDNDSNVLSLGASFVTEEEAKEVVKEWLQAKFTGEERHVRRIEKIDAEI